MKTFKTILLLLVMAGIINSCKKDDDNDIADVGPLKIWDNVKVIDSTIMVLDSTTSDFSSGKYVFRFNGVTPDIKAGDVIVGSTGEGYIRKVTSASPSGNTISLQTSQGNMEDVFENGSFSVNTDFSDMIVGKTGSFSYSIQNRSLYQNGTLSISLESANINMNPQWLFDFTFTPSGIKYFEMSTQNAPYTATARVKVNATQPIELLNRKDTLATYTKTNVKFITVGPIPVPVVIKTNLYLIAESSVDIESTIATAANIGSEGNFTLGVKYNNAQWEKIRNISPNNTYSIDPLSGGVSATVTCAIRPAVSVKLYGSAGPRATIAAIAQGKGTVASPSLDWDFKTEAWLQATAGASVEILGETIADFPDRVWDSPKLAYRMPDKIEKISGDNQAAAEGASLPNPIKVKVTDSKGRAVRNVPVYFNITAGNGNTNPASVLTDTAGYAETVWTLGNGNTQTLTATTKYGDLSPVSNTPVSFNATTDSSSGCNFSTITDPRDGQVYKTVQIGNQTWFAENLRYSGSISQVSDSTQWVDIWWTSSGQPAWCYYNNNVTNGVSYGKLYNWYAVNSSNVCPAGWHVPTDAEWTTLTDYLGGTSVAGGKMKATLGWYSPNTNATNESCFLGTPGGIRSNCCSPTDYYGLGNIGYWWSITQGSSTDAFARGLSYLDGNVVRDDYPKGYGFSVRCIKD